MAPDPKRPRRIKDPKLLKQMHQRPGFCVICRARGRSLHHVLPRGQGGDDVATNLIWLCGHGTAGCHGAVENHDPVYRAAVGRYVRARPPMMAYLSGKVAPETAGHWLDHNYPKE